MWWRMCNVSKDLSEPDKYTMFNDIHSTACYLTQNGVTHGKMDESAK
jgi:hypothetical protein